MDADYNETHEDWASFGLAQELIMKEYRLIMNTDKFMMMTTLMMMMMTLMMMMIVCSGKKSGLIVDQLLLNFLISSSDSSPRTLGDD